MSKHTAWEDEYTLLCERCGYVVEGLDPAGNCPECGMAIAESLPERRVGTPWQQSPGLWSLMRTWWMTLRYPLRTLDVMRVGEANRVMQWRRTLAFVVLLPVPVCLFAYLFLRPHIFRNGVAAMWVFTPALLLIVIPILTAIETRGLQLFSSQRGTRVTRSAARQITTHGSVGWVIMSIGITLSFLLIAGATALRLEVFGANSGLSLRIVRVSWPPALLGLVFGFFFFETFAWLGLRRCRFANRVRPETGGEPEPESARTT
jgi:hypothetical protein